MPVRFIIALGWSGDSAGLPHLELAWPSPHVLPLAGLARRGRKLMTEKAMMKKQSMPSLRAATLPLLLAKANKRTTQIPGWRECKTAWNRERRGTGAGQQMRPMVLRAHLPLQAARWSAFLLLAERVADLTSEARMH